MKNREQKAKEIIELFKYETFLAIDEYIMDRICTNCTNKELLQFKEKIEIEISRRRKD